MKTGLSRAHQSHWFGLAILFVITAWLSGCATVKDVYTQQMDSAPWASYHTFGVTSVETPSQYIYADDMITRAITQDLEAKGYRLPESDTRPDILVRFTTEVHGVQAVTMEQIRNAQGGMFTQYHYKPATEGRLLINVVDQNSGKVVWKALMIRKLNKNPQSIQQPQVDKAIDQALKDFPSRTR